MKNVKTVLFTVALSSATLLASAHSRQSHQFKVKNTDTTRTESIITESAKKTSFYTYGASKKQAPRPHGSIQPSQKVSEPLKLFSFNF